MFPPITVRDCRDVTLLNNVLEAAWLRNELGLEPYFTALTAIENGHTHYNTDNPFLPRFTLHDCDVMTVILFALAGQWARNPDTGAKWRELWETLEMVHQRACGVRHE